MKGRYGPYVKWDKVNATLPKDMEPEAITLEQAIELVKRQGRHKGQKESPCQEKLRRKKPAAKKPAAKKPTTAKKAPPKAE